MLKKSISIILSFLLLFTTLVSVSIMGTSAGTENTDGKYFYAQIEKEKDARIRFSNLSLDQNSKHTISFDYYIDTDMSKSTSNRFLPLFAGTGISGGYQDYTKCFDSDSQDSYTGLETSPGVHNYSLNFRLKPGITVTGIELRIRFLHQPTPVNFYIWNVKIDGIDYPASSIATSNTTTTSFKHSVEDKMHRLAYDGTISSGVPNFKVATAVNFTSGKTYNVTFDYYLDNTLTNFNSISSRLLLYNGSTETTLQIDSKNIDLKKAEGLYSFNCTFTPGSDYTGLGFRFQIVGDDLKKPVNLYIWNLVITEANAPDTNLYNNFWEIKARVNGCSQESLDYNASTVGMKTDQMVKFTTTDSSKIDNRILNTTNIFAGKTYTVSFDYYLSRDINGTNSKFVLYGYYNSKYGAPNLDAKLGSDGRPTGGTEAKPSKQTAGKGHYELTFTPTIDFTGLQLRLATYMYQNQDVNVDLYLWNFKLVEKNTSINHIYNDWTVSDGKGTVDNNLTYSEETLLQAIGAVPAIKGAKVLVPNTAAGQQKLRIDVDFSGTKSLHNQNLGINDYGVIIAKASSSTTKDGMIRAYGGTEAVDISELENITSGTKISLKNFGFDDEKTAKFIINVGDINNYGKRVALIAYVATDRGTYYSFGDREDAVAPDGLASKSVMGVIKSMFKDTGSTVYRNIETAYTDCLKDSGLKTALNKESLEKTYLQSLFEGYVTGSTITTESVDYKNAKQVAAYMFYYAQPVGSAQ